MSVLIKKINEDKYYVCVNHKYLRAKYIYETLSLGYEQIHLITSGNAGKNIKQILKEEKETNRNLVNIVDKNLDSNIKEPLIGANSSILELDLTKRKYSPKELDLLVKQIFGKNSFNATYIEGPQYYPLIEQSLSINPDYVIIPLGSGELYNSFYNYLKKYNHKTKLIGIIPQGNHALSARGNTEITLADKLFCQYITNEAKIKIKESVKNGHQIQEVTNQNLIKANNYAKQLGLTLEYSASSSLLIPKYAQNKKTISVLTGNSNQQ